MPERFPDDATLLASTVDLDTGAPYIPTGQSPYHLTFRKMLQRMLLASARANDLRVYQDGDLTIGVRAGRCRIAGDVVDFESDQQLAITPSDTTYIWIDDTGALMLDTAGLPSDGSAHLPLAQVVADSEAVTTITDLRSQTLFHVPDVSDLGLNITADEINAVLDGINETVDANALNILTGGPTTSADTEHRHLQVFQDSDSEVYFTLMNDNAGSSANIALVLSLPNKLGNDSLLVPDLTNGFIQQDYGGQRYHMLGVLTQQLTYPGDLASTQTGLLLGAVPITGTIVDVTLSVGTNIASATTSDGIGATCYVNGSTLTTTPPALTANDGAGFKSTAQGDGTAAVLNGSYTSVQRGDVITVDLQRNVSGSPTNEAADLVVLVVIQAAAPN